MVLLVGLYGLVVACAAPEPETTSSEALTVHNDHEESLEHDELVGDVIELSSEALTRSGILTALVEKQILAGEIETTGQVDFDETRLAHISPRISGRAHRVMAELGQEVEPGAKLAEIDSQELGQAKAGYLQVRIKEELSRQSFDRVNGLFTEGIVSEQEALEARGELREATAALRAVEETLHLYGLGKEEITALRYEDPVASIYTLEAPFAGTLVEQHVTVGEWVTPERNLFTLADLDQVWVWVDIYQRDLGKVHLEDRVEVRVDAFPDDVFTGKVSLLSPQVDADTRTARARLEVTNRQGRLRPGMFVEVTLFDPHHGDDRQLYGESLVVAETAVVRDGDQAVVFKATSHTRFEPLTVRLGRQAGGYVEILDGLAEGDRVVVAGAFLLKSVAARESLGTGHAH